MRYRAFADELRLRVGPVPALPLSLHVSAWLPMPKSWSRAVREEMRGSYHRSKPDADNILKAVMDALIPDDACIAIALIEKRWEDETGPGLVITIKTLSEHLDQ
jgi:Holliday junction resolvase RusA-like endonuclease